MTKFGFFVLLLVLLPGLALGAERQAERVSGIQAPDLGRPAWWVSYDNGSSGWGWSGSTSTWYVGNIFWPTHSTWYPFTVQSVAYAYINVDGSTTTAGVGGPIKIFNQAGTVLGGINTMSPVAPLAWGSAALTSQPLITAGGILGGIWNDYTGTIGDQPFFGLIGTTGGTAGASLWPPNYRTTTATEPYRHIWGGTSMATAGWATSTQGAVGPAAAFLRVLMSGDTVPVELLALQGRARRGYVVISWGTASEEDNLGFNIYRSDSEDGNYARINEEIVPGHGTTLDPQDYVFADYGVETSHTYRYKVEDVAADGSCSFHGPIAVPTGDNFVSSWGEIKAEFK